MSLNDFFSDKQLDSIRRSNNKINIWEGAVRSGKTYASIWRFIDECVNGPPGHFAIITRTYDTFKRNLLPDFYKILGKACVYKSGLRELYVQNRLIHVIGADDTAAEAKIRGPTFAGIYFDELTILPEPVVKMAFSRASIPGSKIFATTNPDSPLHFVKKELLNGNNRDVTSFQFKMEDNPSLTQDYKDFLKRQYKGLWYQRFIEGKWVQAEGAIYDFFDQSVHCIAEWPTNPTELVIGIDYGTTNPCAFVMIGYNPSQYPNMWVEKEYYWNSTEKQRQKTDREYAEDLIEFIGSRHISAVYVDPSAGSFKQELLRSGVDNLYEADNQVLDGIRFVSNLMCQGTLKITNKCVKLIEEIQGYTWDPKSAILGKDKPIKQADHLLDALRYATFTHFYNSFNDGASESELMNMERIYKPRTSLHSTWHV